MQKSCILYTINSPTLLREWLQIEFIYYKDLNFMISDSMSDLILTIFIEFSVKSYVNSENPMPWQKNSVK